MQNSFHDATCNICGIDLTSYGSSMFSVDLTAQVLVGPTPPLT